MSLSISWTQRSSNRFAAPSGCVTTRREHASPFSGTLKHKSRRHVRDFSQIKWGLIKGIVSPTLSPWENWGFENNLPYTYLLDEILSGSMHIYTTNFNEKLDQFLIEDTKTDQKLCATQENELTCCKRACCRSTAWRRFISRSAIIHASTGTFWPRRKLELNGRWKTARLARNWTGTCDASEGLLTRWWWREPAGSPSRYDASRKKRRQHLPEDRHQNQCPISPLDLKEIISVL